MPHTNEPPFQLIRLLGEGRVGEVWLAQQRTRGGISRLVAVKLLREAWDEDSDAINRLKDEGQALALLQHSCIPGFHEITQIDGRLALVTEYVEGVDLARFGTRGNLLPPRVAVDIVARVASALDWALTTPNPETGRPLNLIHRDVKPANIRLSDQGSVKLLDFGLARSSEMHRHAKTRMGEVLGTPGYAAPEALAFQVSRPPGDVYGLGCTLFELLVGEPFFHGLRIEQQAMLAVQSRDYRDFLAKRLLAVEHPDLRILLAEMLAYSPEKRLKAGTVCDVCEDQIRQMEGPTFPEWNRKRPAEDLQVNRTPTPLEQPIAAAAPQEPVSAAATAPVVEQQALNPWVVGGAVAVLASVLFCCGASSLAGALWFALG
ncbi:MAG: serine/threonine protein kinase [Deltaproteobacteria bacterium]|nr:serine/threonine protein kinase [Deltaproteobacteria bacterium]MBW2254764.1 serine/threonine protein kinase [Deltaproteobacteria bacterium]